MSSNFGISSSIKWKLYSERGITKGMFNNGGIQGMWKCL
ncbi:unnamed protein product [Brugia pahangi]|uniref:Uncharacterized protein n=1 Tax=Brugia pahangi TaxID=6280 RepID=A0A0N4TF68_BRUPA|nr:unnamed protein product [Brugia pahangi]